MRGDGKPVIRILVGLPPGGGTDAIARVIPDRLPIELGQPVIVENKVGVGGRFAADALMAAAPEPDLHDRAQCDADLQTLVFGSQISGTSGATSHRWPRSCPIPSAWR